MKGKIKMKDKELDEYRKRIGVDEYNRQHWNLYQKSLYRPNTRFSHRQYENSEQRLNEIREKYKNGVPKEVINDFANMLVK